MARLFLFVIVLTLVGLPPGFPALRLRDTALRLCAAVILRALDRGTHFGYFRLLPFADLRPQA